MTDLNREHEILERIVSVVDLGSNKEENLRVFIALAIGCMTALVYSSYEMRQENGSYIKLGVWNNNDSN